MAAIVGIFFYPLRQPFLLRPGRLQNINEVCGTFGFGETSLGVYPEESIVVGNSVNVGLL